ncbi:hypothetical protein U9M48_030607 [Paspalum notatum var. saurae]|uniref:Transposase-associated domain-containing protein n=1 Tax=Paspalum notatum var. saurae TaxID=547442 RepID=A0AAQ3U5M1_PASNO
MYDGWDKSGGKAHSAEWRRKTQAFLDHAFSLTTRNQLRCPCNKHNNRGNLLNKLEIAEDLVEFGFTPDYETWTFHGEKESRVEVDGEADDDSTGVDRMDEMLEALQPEFGLNSEDPPTKEVEEFFKLLKASEEPLHEHTKVSVLAFVTRLIAIKSKYFFSNNCFNDLLQLIGDVLPQPHKLPKDMYQCKRLTKSLGMGYENFRKDTVCYEGPPKRLSAQEILDQLASLKLNEEKTAYEGFGKEHNWTHISGIWDLPYAKALILPHNIDVMHKDRNVAESVISMCMDFSDKTKDNIKARKDLAKICNHPTLELTPSGGKPRLKRAVNMKTGKLNGLKAYDYHIIMERLVPVMFRGYLPDGVWFVLAELSYFYRQLYAKEIKKDMMEKLEKDVPVLICKMEKIFPPGMSHRLKQVAKGFVEKIIPSKERLFQGTSTSSSRREALLRCADPNLQGVPIALQRTEGEEDEEEAGGGQQDEEAGGEEAGGGQEDEEAGGDLQEDAGADADLMGGDGSEEVVQRRGTRKSHYINPPPVPAPADRRLIRPIGDGYGHRRTPNAVLGNLIQTHNPGVVVKNGETIPVTTWKHFALAPHVTHGSMQGFVKHKFWKYFRVDPSEVDYAEKVLDQAAKKICKDAFSNLRFQTEHPLFVDQPGPYKEEYGKEMERRHGEGFDWRHAPVNAQAVYDSGGGKTHGHYSMFNGMIDSRQVQRGSSSQSSDGSSGQRRTTSDMEIESLRQGIQKRDAFLKAQKEYQR